MVLRSGCSEALASKGFHVASPCQWCGAVVTHMEHLATTSTDADVKGRAKFIEKAEKASLATFCHFLSDFFDVLSKISFHFQRNDLILPSDLSLLGR